MDGNFILIGRVHIRGVSYHEKMVEVPLVQDD